MEGVEGRGMFINNITLYFLDYAFEYYQLLIFPFCIRKLKCYQESVPIIYMFLNSITSFMNIPQ